MMINNMIGNKSKEELLKENFEYIDKSIRNVNNKYNYNLTDEDREDILQQICLKLYETGFDNFQWQCKVTTYIFKIVENEIRSYVRKRNKIIVSTDLRKHDEQYNNNITEDFINNISYTIDFAQQLTNDEVAKIIKDTVDAMPALQQLIFKLHFVDGIKQEDVAKMCKRSQATIAEHIGNIRKSIKQEVEKKFKGFIKELQ